LSELPCSLDRGWSCPSQRRAARVVAAQTVDFSANLSW
jgi:hypothetical protein